MTHGQTRIGLAGCGRISQAYIEAIQKLPGMQLVAVMDTREDAARATAEATGAKAYSDVESFARAGMDAAIICSPPITHRAVALTLMGEGVHVLCEKPFATTIQDAQAMVDAAIESGLTLTMASKFRYAEDVIRAKSIIASGMLGQVLFYDNCFSGIVNMRERWNSNPAVSGGGVLIDNGTHSVDIVRYLLGPIKKVFAFEGKRVAGLAVEDTVSLSFITKDNVHGTIRLSWSVQVDSATYIDITGTEGALRVGWKGSDYKRNSHPQWMAFGVGYDKVGAFKNQVENFVRSCHGSEAPRITKEEGLSSVAVVDAAYRSLETGRWVEVQESMASQHFVAAK
jgi:predicted dehydrogenase